MVNFLAADASDCVFSLGSRLHVSGIRRQSQEHSLGAHEHTSEAFFALSSLVSVAAFRGRVRGSRRVDRTFWRIEALPNVEWNMVMVVYIIQF